MDINLNIKVYKEELGSKKTGELLQIWAENDRTKWPAEAIEAARQILEERDEDIPLQSPPHFESSSPLSPPLSLTAQVKHPGNLDGVAGWLLILCFSMAILNPIATIANIFIHIVTVYPSLNHFPRLYYIFLIGDFLSILIMFFSIYAGTSLWRRARNAVGIAKKYLFFYLLCRILITFLLLNATASLEPEPELYQSIVRNLWHPLLYIVVCYTYLNISKRVRITYASKDKPNSETTQKSSRWKYV